MSRRQEEVEERHHVGLDEVGVGRVADLKPIRSGLVENHGRGRLVDGVDEDRARRLDGPEAASEDDERLQLLPGALEEVELVLPVGRVDVLGARQRRVLRHGEQRAKALATGHGHRI